MMSSNSPLKCLPILQAMKPQQFSPSKTAISPCSAPNTDTKVRSILTDNCIAQLTAKTASRMELMSHKAWFIQWFLKDEQLIVEVDGGKCYQLFATAIYLSPIPLIRCAIFGDTPSFFDPRFRLMRHCIRFLCVKLRFRYPFFLPEPHKTADWKHNSLWRQADCWIQVGYTGGNQKI